jgi:hypothetical protein
VKTWQKFLISILITLSIGGVYLFSVWKQRQDPGVAGRDDASRPMNADDLAVVRMLFPAHFEDTLRLQGTSVWVKNGYTMTYFRYIGGQVAFAKRVGLIPSAQKLNINKIVKAPVPASIDDGMSHGTRQVFAVFTLPGSADLYATPIGALEGSDEVYYCDILFYYDDPHTIYDNWSKEAWAAIDAHQVKPGMSELQTRMAIGQNMHADSPSVGDRTVSYDQADKHWKVTFVDGRATAIGSN